MSDATDTKTRDRSPGYPAISLETAIGRLVSFEAYFKRSPANPSKVGAAWGLKEGNSDADRWLAALRAYGLVEYQPAPSGVGRQAVLSEDGRNLLRAQQETTKRQILKRAALRPKMIRHFWSIWADDRPADDACLDQLMMSNKFSERGARAFLKVYDATTSYAGLSESDKITPSAGEEEEEDLGVDQEKESPETAPRPAAPALPPAPAGRIGGISLMHGERELTTGLLSKEASFRLIVSGKVGEKEIERLIRKLELDKEILADADVEAEAESAATGASLSEDDLN